MSNDDLSDKDIYIESPIVNTINNLSRKILLLATATHTIYLIIFIIMQVKPLIIFNIFSVSCYLVLQSKPFNRTIPIIFFAIHLEVTLHASVAILLLGWGYGFSYLILCLITLMYISPFKNRKIPYIYGGIEIVVFVLLKLYCMNFEPVYQNVIPIKYENMFLFYNLLTCFTIIVFLSRLNNSTNDLAQYILTETNRDLEQTASHDPLTNLLNRRSMQIKFDELMLAKKSKGRIFCIAIGDIDNFKMVNDTYGHLCGDFVLKCLADVMISCLRDGDYVCRWGGEEFLFLIYDTSAENAKFVIERIQNSIRNSNWVYEGNKLNITMTFGISCCSKNRTIDYCIEEADKYLYKGKQNGKNCVIIS